MSWRSAIERVVVQTFLAPDDVHFLMSWLNFHSGGDGKDAFIVRSMNQSLNSVPFCL